jgi:hypothetical protein
MATISAYPNGSTAHIPRGSESDHERAKRTTIQGWSRSAVRRHTKWLFSIPIESLKGYGQAVTLTLRDCPASAVDFHAMRRAYLMRLVRMGAVSVHWVIEWQRRGVPHIHAAIYFDRPLCHVEVFQLKSHWTDVAEPYGALLGAQYVLPIEGPAGWLQYLSKHAGRGAAHYQRQGMPSGWEKSGRLWGHTGEWTVEEPMRFHVQDAAYFRYRRMVRAWRYADARKASDPLTRKRRMLSARRMLQASDRNTATVRGVSEWVGQEVVIEFLALLAAQGHEIRQTE